MDCWQQGKEYSNFTLFVSTQNSEKWQQIAVTDIDKENYLNVMLDSANLVTPNGK